MSSQQNKSDNPRLLPGTTASAPIAVPNSGSDSGPMGTGRRFSFTQKLLGTSKDLISSFYSFNEKEQNDNQDELNQLMLMQARRRTSSISSDVSADEHQPLERKNSLNERLLTMQVGTFFS